MAIRSQTRLLSSSSLQTPVISTTTNPTETLIPAAISILLTHNRKSRFNNLKSILPPSGISPSQSSSIILALRRNPRLALRFFRWSLHLSPASHNLSSHSTIIHTLARSRLKSQALSLLRETIRSHPDTPPSSLLRSLSLSYRACDSAPFVFDLLIRAYLHSDDLDPALSILRSLRSKGIHPLASTANSLLRSAAKRRGSEFSVGLYREIVGTFRPNSQTFNTLLLALYRDEKTGLNGEILAEMAQFECRPNGFTYSILMAGCDGIAEARRLWGEMRERGIEPDVTAYNTMVRCCCEAGEVGEAEEFFREMVAEGLEPTATTSEILIKAHCRVGDLEAAMKVWRDMRRKGIGVEEEIVDEMVEGMCGKGMVDEGLEFLRGEVGGRRSYEVIIRGFCEAGRMEEAGELQAEMAGRGLDVDERVYEAFICGYERVGEFEMAGKLRREMVGRIQDGDDGVLSS